MPGDPTLVNDIICSLGEFGDFEVVSGGQPNTAFTTYFQAGSKVPDELPGTTSYDDMTLERAFIPDRDLPLKQWYEQFKLGLEFERTAVKRFQSFNGAVIGQESYTVKPMRVDTPDGKAGDSSVAMIRVVCKVTSRQ